MTLLLLAALAHAGLVLDPPPREGEASEVRITDADGKPRPGLTLRVVHRPGLHGQRELGAGITDAHGRSRWTPELPGATALYAGDELIDVVHVHGAPAPASVLVPLGLVGVAALASALAARRRT